MISFHSLSIFNEKNMDISCRNNYTQFNIIIFTTKKHKINDEN